jgi:hypothetical protein
MGEGVMSKRRPFGTSTVTAIEDVWQRRATEAAIAAVRDVAKPGGAIPPGAPVGRLSDIELGWIVAAAIFAWISVRATQATSEGLDTELAIRATGYDPDPWDAGAIAAILPELAELPDIDWSKPFGQWPQDTVINFLITAVRLIRKAMIARDLGGGTITRKSSAAQISRQANAAAGGPLMTPDELNDPIEPL